MNKGRNIAILLLCLCCISVLTFLTTLNRTNDSGVVDNVRYKLVSTNEEIKDYDFYFIEDDKMSGQLITETTEDNEGNVTSQEYTLIITDYPFSYKVTGDSKKTAEIIYTVRDEEGAADRNPYDLFTENFIKAMIFGAAPVLSTTEAIIVAMIAAVGGLILIKNEEIWGYFNKDSGREYPEWNELAKYKVTGGCVIGAAVVLLLIFLIF